MDAYHFVGTNKLTDWWFRPVFIFSFGSFCSAQLNREQRRRDKVGGEEGEKERGRGGERESVWLADTTTILMEKRAGWCQTTGIIQRGKHEHEYCACIDLMTWTLFWDSDSLTGLLTRCPVPVGPLRRSLCWGTTSAGPMWGPPASLWLQWLPSRLNAWLCVWFRRQLYCNVLFCLQRRYCPDRVCSRYLWLSQPVHWPSGRGRRRGSIADQSNTCSSLCHQVPLVIFLSVRVFVFDYVHWVI